MSAVSSEYGTGIHDKSQKESFTQILHHLAGSLHKRADEVIGNSQLILKIFALTLISKAHPQSPSHTYHI